MLDTTNGSGWSVPEILPRYGRGTLLLGGLSLAFEKNAQTESPRPRWLKNRELLWCDRPEDHGSLNGMEWLVMSDDCCA